MVSVLLELTEKTDDIHITPVAVEALGKIGTLEVMAFLETLVDAAVRTLRVAAQRIAEAARGEETH